MTLTNLLHYNRSSSFLKKPIRILFKLSRLYILIVFSFFHQDKIDNAIKEDFKVLSNKNCQGKLLDDAFKYRDLKVDDSYDRISIEKPNTKVTNTTKDSIQNLNKSDFSVKYTTENVIQKGPLIAKAKLFAKNTDIHKVIFFKFIVVIL